MAMGLGARLAARIQSDGPLRFDEFLDAALYDSDDGFYAGDAGAGRGRDFLTSPEVGPLFGAVLANAVDAWWDESGRPDEWVVVDAGAGPGALLRSLLAAEPRCRPALRPVAVDRAAAQRAEHGDGVESLADLPDGPLTGVIVANELLDNVPWRLLERTDVGWAEILVDTDADGSLGEQAVPVDRDGGQAAARLAPEASTGSRIALQHRAGAWLSAAFDRLEHGRIVVLDYASSTPAMATRPWSDWTRTYRGHERGGHPLDAPGSQDVTCEVAVDQLAAVRAPDADVSQADFLRAHGLDDLVEEGRAIWAERAHLGDLEAMKARSRIGEAEALCDPAGLGGFRVLEWVAG